MTKIASNLQIDSARLWDTIHETAKFGATPKGGVRRLTLGPEDKQVRDWFRTACEAAGLEVHVDALGSMFGLRKGRDMSKAPVGLGSHLDTQPTGGFDMSRPLRKPNIDPSASTWTSRPAASHALRNQSRTCLSSGPSVSRRTPPFGVAPNFAVS